ncbi:glycoside hydrolase family 88/105 protein [Alkalihalobacillus hemicellulosilyticus]|uniref:Rhamnogalacturonides degradation protein RhiN n=1 Tax=Halalkalibacter hemicellulosilyticusJCM 9152 TaxID=1236971 RepID=W4QL64_9BACI|nr:glycoside hydrolase family 88 protein [Halalkalibacter hemicellulosilyticus]GAE32642.1 rhamnogalacturonides degradation protein RhiN [Halalkalibacter hemicellulosilyticusJCM 9152]
MKPLVANEEQLLQVIDRMVERTFTVDYSWDWPAGVAFYGVGIAFRATGKEQYIERLQEWVDEYIAFGLPPMSVNIVSMGHTLLTLYQETGDTRYLELAQNKADYLLNDALRFAEGVLQHTVGVGRNDFPEQAWIDTLFMAGYFLIRIGTELRDERYTQDGFLQFQGHEKYLQDPITNLYYHGWDHVQGNNMSSIYWARGNAWAAYTMAQVVRMIDVKEPAFMEIYGSLRDQLSALIELQSDKGLWHTVLTDPTSYEETSGSAGIGAALVLTGHTPKSYRAAQRALEGMLEKVDKHGNVLDVSTGTAVMNTVEGYLQTSKKRIEGWGQGLALTFFSHVLLRNKKAQSYERVNTSSE